MAAERIANAPPAAWPLAAAGLAELLSAIPGPLAELRARQNVALPIVCPHCGELSASPIVCDICGQPLRQNGEAA